MSAGQSRWIRSGSAQSDPVQVNPVRSGVIQENASLAVASEHLTPEIAIAAQGIKMMFRSGSEVAWVLQGVDLAVPTGELHFLMGPSGVGKTTLLSILAGILTPTEGSVTLLGRNLQQLSKADAAQLRLKHVGFIFQELNLLASLTALENVALALHLKGIEGTSATKQAQRLLEQVNLADKAKQLPRSLSGGEKQRVAIARALAGHPHILFADEPTSALDSHNGYQVVNLLRQLAHEENHTVLMATHDHRFTEYADRILTLEDGKLV